MPDRGRSPGFGWIPRGKTRSLAVLQLGRPTIWSKCRSWRSDCVQKYGTIESATIPSSRCLETLNVAARTPCNHVNAAESTRSTLRWDKNPTAWIFDFFENLVQTQFLGFNQRAHVSNLLSLRDSSNSQDAYSRSRNQIRKRLCTSYDARMPTLPVAGCELARGWQSLDDPII